MHRTTNATRTHSRPRTGTGAVRRTARSTGSLRTRTFKNRLATLHAAQRLGCACGCGVNGSRTRLRHNHALSGRSGGCRWRGCGRRLRRSRTRCRRARTRSDRLFHRSSWRGCRFNRGRRSLRRSRGRVGGRGCRARRFCLLRRALCGYGNHRGGARQPRRRRLHNHRALRRAGRNRRSRSRGGHNLWRLARQRNNLPWSRLRARRSAGRRSGRSRAHRCAGGCRPIPGWRSRGRIRSGRRNRWLRSSSCGGRHCRTRRCRGHGTMHSLRFTLFFLLLNGAQNISRPGNMGQINLRLLLDCCGPRGCIRRGLSTTAQGGAYTPGLVFLYRTGVRLLLRHTYLWQDVENHSAFHFQLSC